SRPYKIVELVRRCGGRAPNITPGELALLGGGGPRRCRVAESAVTTLNWTFEYFRENRSTTAATKPSAAGSVQPIDNSPTVGSERKGERRVRSVQELCAGDQRRGRTRNVLG